MRIRVRELGPFGPLRRASRVFGSRESSSGKKPSADQIGHVRLHENIEFCCDLQVEVLAFLLCAQQ